MHLAERFSEEPGDTPHPDTPDAGRVSSHFGSMAPRDLAQISLTWRSFGSWVFYMFPPFLGRKNNIYRPSCNQTWRAGNLPICTLILSFKPPERMGFHGISMDFPSCLFNIFQWFPQLFLEGFPLASHVLDDSLRRNFGAPRLSGSRLGRRDAFPEAQGALHRSEGRPGRLVHRKLGAGEDIQDISTQCI